MSHLFLTGFMGAGKTTVGRAVAERLERPFIDLDAAIEQTCGMSVMALFAERGEIAFREAEHDVLKSLEDASDAVVATGGGIVLRDDNRVLLRRLGTVVYLAITPEEALARLGDAADRPLLAGRGLQAAHEILGARRTLYAATADHVVDTGGLTPAEVADQVVALFGEGYDHAVCVIGPPSYEIVIGRGTLNEAGRLVGAVVHPTTTVLVTDETVGGLYADVLSESINAAGYSVTRVSVAPGESSKSWETAGGLLEAFAAARLDRGSLVIALGGGVVGDLAGFCAATYMRGIDLVQVPTTLLAQVDSSIGGKTAVDLDAGKNLAGAFWAPRLVIADTAVLDTLPAEEWTNGLVEVVKTALLAGEESLAALERDLDALLAHEPDAVGRMVRSAAAFKARIVSADEREGGERECLNLGHTLGHALEMLSGYGALPHGRAVAEGLRFAVQLSALRGVANVELLERVGELLDRIGSPRLSVGFTAHEIAAAMRADKKSRAGVVRFVLLEQPGVWRVDGVDDDTLEQALERWLAEGGR